MAYFNTSGISGTAGNLYGTNRVSSDVFKGSPYFGTEYFDTADDGRVGFARFADVLGGDTKFKSYVMSKYPDMYHQFGAASGDDPNMTWTKWLEGNQDKLVGDWANMAPSDRGESPGRSLGKLRWL